MFLSHFYIINFLLSIPLSFSAHTSLLLSLLPYKNVLSNLHFPLQLLPIFRFSSAKKKLLERFDYSVFTVSPPVLCHRILIRLLPPPLPKSAFQRSLMISVLLNSMVNAHSSSHLTYQHHLMQLIIFHSLETLSSLEIQSNALPASFTDLSSSPSLTLGFWTSPISLHSLLGSHGFKYNLCVDNCQIILPCWTAPPEILTHLSNHLLSNSTWISKQN